MGSTSSATGIAVGVAVAAVVILLLGVAAFFYMRRRSTGHVTVGEVDGRRSVVLERSHPASRAVTPFGMGNETPQTPRFHHKPGEDMRFARRREDGGWDFTAPLAIDPFAAAPFEGPSRCASPTSSIGASSYYSRKEKVPGEPTARGYTELDIYGVAPPAYTPHAT